MMRISMYEYSWFFGSGNILKLSLWNKKRQAGEAQPDYHADNFTSVQLVMTCAALEKYSGGNV